MLFRSAAAGKIGRAAAIETAARKMAIVPRACRANRESVVIALPSLGKRRYHSDIRKSHGCDPMVQEVAPVMTESVRGVRHK